MTDDIELAEAPAPAPAEPVPIEYPAPEENSQPSKIPARPQRVKIRGQSSRPSPTAEAYVQAVSHYASENSHSPGTDFVGLSRLLQQHYRSVQPSRLYRAPDTNGQSFATLYTFREQFDATPVALRDPSQFVELLRSNSQEENIRDRIQGYMLFLSGYPSSEWLATIGAQCRVDPDYFRRHMKFLSLHQNQFTYPSLPSALENIITLTVTTIGTTAHRGKTTQSAIDNLRLRGLEASSKYEHRLMTDNAEIGDSLFKSYLVHDEVYFSIEQEISISLNRVDGQWFLLIWLDAGNDRATSLPGPWLPEPRSREIVYLPTITQRKKIALKGSALPSLPGALEMGFSRSTLLLKDNYGRFLNREVMAVDPFYALNELFAFAASSELQFLNLVESRLDLETGHAVLSQTSPSLSNLLYHQEILQSHARRLRENIETINIRGGPEWPRKQGFPQTEEACRAAQVLLRDFEYLLSKAEELLQRCDRGKSVIMNNANLAESRRMGKLTFLAFFYVPLSFTTSFFGMNFQQFGTSSSLTIWIWFVVSVPILVLSVLLYLYDINGFFQDGYQKLRRKFGV